MRYVLRSIFFCLCSTALFTTGAAAQCPALSISAPSDEVIAGESVTFNANIVSGDSKSAMTLSFNWSISAGTISSGQGSSVITVDTADLAGKSVTATLEIGGLPAACARTASATASVKPSVVAVKIDDFGSVNEELEWAKLDNFVIVLNNEPNAEGYIISYRGPKSPAGEAKAVNKRYIKYLVEMRSFDANRLKTIDGGIRQMPSREFWIVPMGAKPPKPSPMAVTPKPVTPKKLGSKKNT